MKIKNLSNQDLKIAIKIGIETVTCTMKPNQVMYSEDNALITKQLVIYEKKRLINLNKSAEKPDYVENYKPFYEAGTYKQPVNKNIQTIDLDDDIEANDSDESVFEIESIDGINEDEMDSEEGPTTAIKKGRGRPKKPVSDQPVQKEKKQRGRPKGSTKK